MCILCNIRKARTGGQLCEWCLMGPVREAGNKTDRIQEIEQGAIREEILRLQS